MNIKFRSDCPLCQLDKITTWYHEEEDFVILDCEICGVPMGVMREHGTVITNQVSYDRMIVKLSEVADQVFGQCNWWLDKVERTIKDHKHAHARGNGWR